MCLTFLTYCCQLIRQMHQTNCFHYDWGVVNANWFPKLRRIYLSRQLSSNHGWKFRVNLVSRAHITWNNFLLGIYVQILQNTSTTWKEKGSWHFKTHLCKQTILTKYVDRLNKTITPPFWGIHFLHTVLSCERMIYGCVIYNSGVTLCTQLWLVHLLLC